MPEFQPGAPEGLPVNGDPSQVVVWFPLTQFHLIVSPTAIVNVGGLNVKLETATLIVVEFESVVMNIRFMRSVNDRTNLLKVLITGFNILVKLWNTIKS